MKNNFKVSIESDSNASISGWKTELSSVLPPTTFCYYYYFLIIGDPSFFFPNNLALFGGKSKESEEKIEKGERDEK